MESITCTTTETCNIVSLPGKSTILRLLCRSDFHSYISLRHKNCACVHCIIEGGAGTRYTTEIFDKTTTIYQSYKWYNQIMAARTPPPYGGHDNDFVNQDLEKLTCTICTKVVRNPHLTACCGQNFCSSCLTQWFTKTKKESCPHCRAEGRDFQHIPDKKAKREVNDLQVRCSNKKEGCSWVGKLVDLKKHLDSENGCEFVEVECPYKCGCFRPNSTVGQIVSDTCRPIPRPRIFTISTFQRKHLSKHIREECPKRPSTCEYCGLKGQYDDIRRHIEYDCFEKPLKCPNKCDAKPIKRKYLGAHRNVCPLQIVSCPFNNAGCSVKIVRKDLDNHVTANTQQHLLQTFQRMEKLQQETDSKMKAMQAEVGFLQQTDLSQDCVKTSLACMSTHLHPGNGESIFRMTGFSNYKKNGEVWQSPSFHTHNYSDTHLCLDVNPGGIGSGKGSHVSLSIVAYTEGEGVMSPSYDNYYEVTVRLLDQLPPAQQQSASRASPSAKMDTSKEWVSEIAHFECYGQSKEKTLCVNEQFVSLCDLYRYLHNDSLVFTCTCTIVTIECIWD